ncbi:MAG TPA: alpha/beta hydrolase [Trebonia sp.]
MQITMDSGTSSDGVREQSFSLGEIPGVLWTPALDRTTANGTPDEATARARPLIFMGHGGGQHKKAPGIVARARRFVTECGYAVASVDVPNHGDRSQDERYAGIVAETQARIAAGADTAPLIASFQALVSRQTVPEWRQTLDALQHLDHVGEGPVGYWGISMGCGLGLPFVAAEPRVRAAVLGLGGASAPEADDAARKITVPVEFLLQWDDERIPREAGLRLFGAFGSPEKTLHANPGKHMELPRHEVDSNVRFFRRHLGVG